MAGKPRHSTIIKTTCRECGSPVTLDSKKDKGRYDHFKQTGRVYCSRQCSTEHRRRVSSQTMAETNRKYASSRMKARNPMKDPKVRAKVSKTLQEMNWGPQIQGGNGRGPTKPQRLLAEALGWPMEITVPTKTTRGHGYPTHYKVDVGHPELKVAIEVDGPSHQSLVVKKQDRKKEAFLRSRGWIVLRFSNQEVMDDLAGCVRTVMSTISRLRGYTHTSPMGS